MLATLLLFTAFTSSMEAAHDVGVNHAVRGTIALKVQSTAIEQTAWTVDLMVSMESIVRENRRNETAFRISPEHINYPVAIRWRQKQPDSAYDWAVIARHQSNHDIDVIDASLVRETISYEVYGVQWLFDAHAIEFGVYYDRGTRLNGRKQYWPFDYFLAGARIQGRLDVSEGAYLAYDTEWVAHRNSSTELPHLDISGHVDLGWSLPGQRGQMNAFLRTARLTNYQFLGDTPEHAVMLGMEIWGGESHRSQWF